MKAQEVAVRNSQIEHQEPTINFQTLFEHPHWLTIYYHIYYHILLANTQAQTSQQNTTLSHIPGILLVKSYIAMAYSYDSPKQDKSLVDFPVRFHKIEITHN